MGSADDIVRVLLVDDEEVDRARVKNALASRHARVMITECASAEEAFQKLETETFACVLLDYLLPGTTALNLLPKLGGWLTGTPVIVLTDHGDEQVAVDLMKGGATDCMIKAKLDGRSLERAIEQAASLGDARRRLERAERSQRVYLKRLRQLVEVTPALYGVRTLEGRLRVALSAAQALFGAEETFVGIDVDVAPMLRVTRGEQFTQVGPDTPVWPAVFEGAKRKASDAKVEISAWPERTVGAPSQLYQVPMHSSERVWIGVFGMRVTPPPPSFAELTASLFEQFGKLIAVAMENAELYEQASRAIAARDAVMAVVSHDLRSPLNSFNLSLELLRDTNPDGPDRTILERMQRGVMHMNRLIEDLLDVSRIERDELNLSPSMISVAVLLDELQAMAAPIAQAAGITLAIGPRLDVMVKVDRHRVLQLLGNLVNNALKFSPKGRTVSVSSKLEGDEVVCSVSDEGPGISAEDRARVFERFYRHGGNGLGLGLHISRAIVEAHGGRIWVESEPGAGARFSFTLRPIERGERPSEAGSLAPSAAIVPQP